MKEIRLGKVGFSSFCLLFVAAVSLFIVGHRPDMYCFAPRIDNWAHRFAKDCLLAEFGSLLIALGALFIDKDRLFAILTLASFVPLNR